MLDRNTIRYWTPAVAALLCMALSMGLMTVFGFFVDPVAADFGVSHATVTTAPVFLMIVPAFTGPIFGRMADSLPIRWMMWVGVVIAMGSLYQVSQASSITAAALWFIGFVVGLGLCGPVVINSLLTKLYLNNSGRALALAAMGASVAAVLLPLWIAWLFEHGDWRSALASLSLVIMVFMISVIALGIPASNAALVQAPDEHDEAVPDSGDDAGEAAAQSSIFRDPSFWLIGIGMAVAFNGALVLSICYAPHLLNIGLSVTQSALVISAGGIGGFIGKGIVAAVVDRYRDRVKWVAAAVLAVQVLGLIVLASSTVYPLILFAALLVGFGGGAFIPMHAILNSCYFHDSIVGRVNGAQMPLFLPLGLVGAPLTGYAYDQLGHYYWVLFAIIAVLVIAALLLLRLPKARPLEGPATAALAQ